MDWLTSTTIEPLEQAASDPVFTPTNPSSLTLAVIGVMTLILFRWLRTTKYVGKNSRSMTELRRRTEEAPDRQQVETPRRVA